VIRVTIATDIRVYLDGLVRALGEETDVEVVGATAEPNEALRLAREHAPDIALVDMALPDALALVHALRGIGPAVVALAVPEREPDVLACVEAGASGYVTREASLSDLVESLRSVARGETLCSPRIAGSLVRRLAALAEGTMAATLPRLTERELEIVGLIDDGLSNKEIAARLSIGVSTVKNHVHHILEKLRVRRRSEAAACVRGSVVWRARRLEHGASTSVSRLA